MTRLLLESMCVCSMDRASLAFLECLESIVLPGGVLVVIHF